MAAAPDDLHLRLHLAHLLVEAGQPDEAVRHAATVLQRDPGHRAALELIARRGLLDGAGAGRDASASEIGSGTTAEAATGGEPDPAPSSPIPDPATSGPASVPEAEPAPPAVAADRTPIPAPLSDEEVLRRLDSEFTGLIPPMFVGPEPPSEGRHRRIEYDRYDRYEERDDWYPGPEPEDPDYEPDDGDELADMLGVFTPETSDLRMADVAGMDEVKARLEAAVLAPIRNPDLTRLYAKSLRGGLLLYGPPGCGKTFIARALAGELGARLLSVSLADVLDVYVGQSERNVHAVFEIARQNAPCVIFLDEVDAIGQKRSQLRSSASRGTVNQLLTEMDGLAAHDEGVYVLGATNHPWDVDVAFRRPGRFDRMVLVLPPDEPAREAVLRHHLRDRPIAGVDPARLARLTGGYSAADLAYVCESAAERALLDSVRTGHPRMIGMPDLEAAIADSRPSLGPWLQTARNVAEFANADGSYDELLAYLRGRERA